jgi:hypothetical protein
MSRTRTDIANRALQRCGAAQIAAGALLTEDSTNALEVRSCYDNLRQAELRRNIWRFATRKSVLRALDTTTKLVTFPTWLVGTTYAVNAIVALNNQLWFSLVGANTGNTPSDDDIGHWSRYFGTTTATPDDSTLAYATGELVSLAGVVYMSNISGNSDIPPTANWTTINGATLTALSFMYPIGAGPLSQSETRNVFMLPNGFLRQAPDDPAQGSYHPLGAPVNVSYNDFLFEGNFLISRTAGPILLRYCADIADPSAMDPMFVEGFACRLALEVVERLTQSSAKLQSVASEYKNFMGEARLVNGIETGPTEPPEDDYLICRL